MGCAAWLELYERMGQPEPDMIIIAQDGVLDLNTITSIHLPPGKFIWFSDLYFGLQAYRLCVHWYCIYAYKSSKFLIPLLEENEDNEIGTASGAVSGVNPLLIGERILKVIKTIENITFETNIPALNASAAASGQAYIPSEWRDDPGFVSCANEAYKKAKQSGSPGYEYIEQVETEH